MAKCIIWCRVSTTEQEFETQRIDLRKRAAQDGFSETDMIDIGKAGASAIKMNELYQEEVNELLRKIEENKDVTTIYVWEVSRLARNECAFYQMKEKIVANHIQFICNVPQLTLFDKDGEINRGAELTLNLLVTLAKQEMEIKKKRFSRGKKRLADEGKYNGGAIPYGYKINPETKKIEIDEDGEAKIVREIFDMYEHGYSQMGIAKELFARGVKGKSAKKVKNFTISLVHQILTNELLTGKKHKFPSASFERQYPPIITEEQFNRCREIAKNNNTVAPKSLRVYYALGLMKCTQCGSNFKSGGKKGQYQCRDAYDHYKTYNGYAGVPKCTNKLNISINVMDSLLWELAIDFEATFILNDAEKKLKECEKEKDILTQKLETIPSHREIVKEKRKRLRRIYAMGKEDGAMLSDEEYNEMEADIKEEENKINKQEVEYIEQINHYNSLIEEVKKSIDMNFDFSNEDAMQRYVETGESVRDRVVSITDDLERRRIVHKHIKKVTIEKSKIKYKFIHYPEEKEADAKKIIVYPYASKPRTFYFIPNNGKGGKMVEWMRDQEETITSPITGEEMTLPKYVSFDYKYLNRVVDNRKYEKRQAIRDAKMKKLNKEREEMLKKGYITLDDMAVISGRPRLSVYYSMKNGMVEGVKVSGQWYCKKDDFENYLKKSQERKLKQLQKRAKKAKT